MDYEKKYLQVLKEKYQIKAAVLTEIINLEAILHLPKGTEHFVSDLHGEISALQRILRTGSGAIQGKISELFTPQLTKEAQQELAFLVYYPKERLNQVKEDLQKRASAGEKAEVLTADLKTFYQISLEQLVYLTRFCGKKYSRSKVRKALPKKYAYILEELLTEIKKDPWEEKPGYCQGILTKIIALNQGEDLIIELTQTICRLVVDHLHVVGDIFDRGSHPDEIMTCLMQLPSVDIQWGNHDINWLGAVSGSPLSMMTVIRICARYDNLSLLEESYGIPLRPLIDFAKKYYTPKKSFQPKKNPDHLVLSKEQADTLNILQQAAHVFQLKLEDALISRRPEFHLENRQVLRHLNFKEKTYLTPAGEVYPLKDFPWDVLNPKDPACLTSEEEEVLQHLLQSFQQTKLLKEQMDFLLKNGSMYLTYNHNLLFHGCIPLHENGDFKGIRLEGKNYSGPALLDFYDEQVRKSYGHPEKRTDFPTDLLWYLWCGECSSLFGKKAMATFERYYIEETSTHAEEKNAYYALRNQPRVVEEILASFHLENGHVINGHTPVKEKRGEDPVKAEGKLIVIDGGFAKGYQATTGIAGYTLVYNSYGMELVSHLQVASPTETLKNRQDLLLTRRLVEQVEKRLLIKETNVGLKLSQDKDQLEKLYEKWETL